MISYFCSPKSNNGRVHHQRKLHSLAQWRLRSCRYDHRLPQIRRQRKGHTPPEKKRRRHWMDNKPWASFWTDTFDGRHNDDKKIFCCYLNMYIVSFLQVLSQQINPGIKYEYLLPTSLATSEEATDVDYFSSGEDNLPLNYKLKAANSQANTTSTGRKKRKYLWKVIGFTPCRWMKNNFLANCFC